MESIKEIDQDISLMKALSTNILSVIHSLLVNFYYGILSANLGDYGFL